MRGDRYLTRREMLQRSGTGFGILGLAGLLHSQGLLARGRADGIKQAAMSTSGRPHFEPRARRVIFLYMTGGPSQIDTFDPKPKLKDVEGQHPNYQTGEKIYQGLGYQPSSFKFARRGESGQQVSELFPHLARQIDDVCVIRSMTTDIPNHEQGNFMMNCGTTLPNRPCLGSWVSYGLGTANENLPGYVVLTPGLPTVGEKLWNSAFLPGANQGMRLDTSDMQIEHLIRNIKNGWLSADEQRRQLALVRRLDRLRLQERHQDNALEAQLKAMELAFLMQSKADEACDIGREPKYIREAYGESDFAHGCLLARRLAERGVRFIQLYYTHQKKKQGNQPWDTHFENDPLLRELALDADRPIAALLADLKQRGMLDDTLVLWGGEFGRTPWAEKQSKNRAHLKFGRDHHHTAFTVWLAGGGIRGGMTYGRTDELCNHVVENKVHIHDLHATILHLLGVDHTQLTYQYSGRDFRLTDVYGQVVREILV